MFQNAMTFFLTYTAIVNELFKLVFSKSRECQIFLCLLVFFCVFSGTEKIRQRIPQLSRYVRKRTKTITGCSRFIEEQNVISAKITHKKILNTLIA